MQCEMDPITGAPADALTQEVVQLLSKLGSSATTVSQVIDSKDEAVYSAIQKVIDAVNEEAVSNPQKVRLWYQSVDVIVGTKVCYPKGRS